MFGNKFEAAYAVSCFFKLIGDIIFVIGEFIAEIFTNFNYFFIVIYNADFSENNYTVYIERPFAVFSVSFVVCAKRYFVTFFNRIKFMSFFGTVKINAVFDFVILIINRKSVRIAVIADYGEDSADFVFKNFLTFGFV